MLIIQPYNGQVRSRQIIKQDFKQNNYINYANKQDVSFEGNPFTKIINWYKAGQLEKAQLRELNKFNKRLTRKFEKTVMKVYEKVDFKATNERIIEMEPLNNITLQKQEIRPAQLSATVEHNGLKYKISLPDNEWISASGTDGNPYDYAMYIGENYNMEYDKYNQPTDFASAYLNESIHDESDLEIAKRFYGIMPKAIEKFNEFFTK